MSNHSRRDRPGLAPVNATTGLSPRIEALCLAPDADVEFVLADNGDVLVRNVRGAVLITPETHDLDTAP